MATCELAAKAGVLVTVGALDLICGGAVAAARVTRGTANGGGGV